MNINEQNQIFLPQYGLRSIPWVSNRQYTSEGEELVHVLPGIGHTSQVLPVLKALVNIV